MTTPDPVQHLNWGAEALWQQLAPWLPGISVEVVARLDSTNSRLLDRARRSSGSRDGRVTRPGDLDALAEGETTPHGRRQADVQPCLLVAEHQLRGRGRVGRHWMSRPGASLTFSLSMPLAPADWSGLSLAVGLALADACDPPRHDEPPRLMIKWPNDLWLSEGPGLGRKLGGILIETVSVGQHRMCVVGVGLNVLPLADAEASPGEELAHGYACLHEIDPAITAPQALAQVALPLARALLRFERDGFAPLAAPFARRDLLAGQPVTTTAAGMSEGVAEGVDERGALRLRCDGVHRIVSGEVSVRVRAGSERA